MTKISRIKKCPIETVVSIGLKVKRKKVQV